MKKMATAPKHSTEKSIMMKSRLDSTTSTTADKTEKSQNIQVAVRVRPLNDSEKKHGTINVVNVNPNEKKIVVREKGEKQFTYNKVFGPNSKQIDIYREMVVPLLQEVTMGYNCTIFAYGQTGTGKTFTMEGDRSSDQASALVTWENDPLAGIIPRALHQLFETLTTSQADFTIRVSFIELYNEELFDLLGAEENSLRLYDDPVKKGSVVIQGLEEVIVQSKEEVYEILERGARKRATAATLLNAQSSRSHSVFSVTVHIREGTADGEEMLKIGKLYLVDLAGSENIGRSGAVDKRAREAGSINQSLLTLGRVITALVEHARHIPYRESKLTRLLQDSLGGKTKTSIIATVSPSSNCTEETVSTLEYARRAMNITNKPEINQKVSKQAMIKQYAEEIERLRRDLQAAREKHGIYLPEQSYTDMMQKQTHQEELIKELEERIAIACQESEKALTSFASTKEQLNAANEKLGKVVGKLEKARTKLVETKTDYLDAIKDRDERQFLLEEHELAQSILHNQAEELITLNEKAVQNIQNLHGKLDRMKVIQETNELQLGEYRDKIVEKVEEMKESLNTFSAVQQEIGAEEAHFVDSLVKEFENRCSNAKASLTKLHKNFKSNMKAFKDLFEATEAQFESEAAEVISRVDEVYQAMENGIRAIAVTQKKRQDLVAVHEDKENEQLDDIKEITAEFVEHQFARDAPTGNTPSRQSTVAHVPRDLARLSPNNRLLERFREQYVAPEISADLSIMEDTLNEEALEEGLENGDSHVEQDSGRAPVSKSLENSNGVHNGVEEHNGGHSGHDNKYKGGGYHQKRSTK